MTSLFHHPVISVSKTSSHVVIRSGEVGGFVCIRIHNCHCAVGLGLPDHVGRMALVHSLILLSQRIDQNPGHGLVGRRAPSHLDSYIDMISRQVLQHLGALRRLGDLPPDDDWGRHSPHLAGQVHLCPGDVVNTPGWNNDHRSKFAGAVALLVQAARVRAGRVPGAQAQRTDAGVGAAVGAADGAALRAHAEPGALGRRPCGAARAHQPRAAAHASLTPAARALRAQAERAAAALVACRNSRLGAAHRRWTALRPARTALGAPAAPAEEPEAPG